MSFFDVQTKNAFLDLVDDNGEPMGMRLELRPTSSKEVQRADRAGQSELMDAMKKGKQTAMIARANVERFLAAHIAGWSFSENPRITDASGNEIPVPKVEYSEESALSLIQDKDLPFVRAQVDEYVGKTSNFYVTSQKDSAKPSE